MAHYSSGLSLLRTSPHDPTFQGSSPGISVPMLGQTTQSISSTQLFNHSDSLEHFGTNFSVVPFSWSGKFHGFSSMLSAIQRTAKTIQNTSCEEWLFSLALVSIQSQVIHGGLAFFTSAEPQEDQLWQLIRPQRSLLLPISQTCPPARIRPAN